MIGLIVVFVSQSVFAWCKPYRDPSDNTLQMLCQTSIFFALLSKVVLDHPDMTGTQSNVLSAVLIALVVLPFVVTLLHAVLDPTEEAVDDDEEPALAMIP